MSKLATRQRSSDHDDLQDSAGGSFYNPNTSQDLYNREFSGIASGLSDVEQTGKKIINDNADEVRKQESEAIKSSPVIHNGRPAKIRQLLTSKKLRGKTALITVILVLFGGGGAISIFASPSLAIVQLRQVLTEDLNDQLKAFENRHSYLTRVKLKTATNGSCGVIKLACRFATMSDKQAERFTKKGIAIERDPKGSIIPGRGKVLSMTFPNPDGGDPIKISSASELADRMRSDSIVRKGMQRAENPWFASMTDKTFKTSLRILGTSKTSRISGDTPEEREKSVNSVIGEGADLDAKDLTPEIGEDGKETGRMIGPDGEVMTPEQIKLLDDSAMTAESATKIKPSSIASSIGKGVMVTGAIDSACTVYNAMRLTGALAKVEKAKQAAQMVMPTLLVPADKVMAGVATETDTTYVGNKINNIGGPQQPDEVVDESKIYEAGSDTNPPMKKNPALYETAFDSPGVKAALHGDVIPLDSNHGRFSLAGGFIGTLNNVNSFIATVVSGGNPDPKVISDKCKYIQNPYVRGASLIAGIFVGIGSFGTFQAFSIAASLAVSMALPYAISIAADIASGDMFKNLYGSDFGSGAFVGTAAIMSVAAQRRGMKPLSAKEAVTYTRSNQETLARYADTERQLARSEPFNVYNKYSFLGSIASTVTPTLGQTRASASTMAMGIIGLLPTSLASATPVKADDSIERFQQCRDPGYIALNIGADIYCNVRYGLGPKELSLDPIENAEWMVSSGNVSPDDELGTPVDNGQKWNYKKFMDECANRTVGYGEDQEENQGDGANCLSEENEVLNTHFRVFTMDLSVMDYMDGNDEADSTTTTSDNGDVSTDGWAYPTTKDGNVTSGYKAPERGDDHRGVDITHSGGSLGKAIYAARDGKVIASGPASGFGNWIVILHPDVDGKEMSSVYGHMRANDLMVKTGDSVKAGQQIARIGSEGQSTGPHLHFEIWNGNRLQCRTDCSVDPTPIIEAAKTNSTSRREGDERS